LAVSIAQGHALVPVASTPMSLRDPLSRSEDGLAFEEEVGRGAYFGLGGVLVSLEQVLGDPEAQVLQGGNGLARVVLEDLADGLHVAAHVAALHGRWQVDRHVKSDAQDVVLGGVGTAHAHEFAHPRHADPAQLEPGLGQEGLDVGEDGHGAGMSRTPS
jgi:hypothetical protein